MKAAFKRHCIVLALYAVLAVMMSWPLALSLTTHLAGSGGDPWQTLWRFDATWNALQAAPRVSDFVQTEFLGGGEPRLVNVSVWPWMWLHRAVGEPLAYNLIWLLSFTLSGYGVYLLTGYLFSFRQSDEGRTKSFIVHEAPRFLAGLMYMFLPFHVAHAFGHFGAMQTQWLPLAVFALWRLLRRPTLLGATAFSALVIIQAWSEHHYALWLALFTVMLLIFERGVVRTFIQSPRGISALLLAATLIVIGVILPYWPTARLATDAASLLDLGKEQLIRFSADPFAYVLPASFHPVWGGFFHAIFGQRLPSNEFEATQYLGLVPLLLVIFFYRTLPVRQRRFWLGAGVFFFLISLGPRLHLFGVQTNFPLPYELIDRWLIISAVRTVARAGVMVGLSLAVLAGWVFRAQLHRPVSVFLVGGIILLDFLFVPVPLQSAALPHAYDVIRDYPGSALIELPAATNYVTASKSLYGSLKHQKKIVGNIALERAQEQDYFTEVRSIPALRQLLYLRTQNLLEERPDFLEQDFRETFADTLKWLDVGVIVVHPDSLSAVQLAAVKNTLEDDFGWTPQIIDDVLVYQTDPLPSSDGLFAMRDDGWEAVTYKEETGYRAQIPLAANLTFVNTHAETQTINLAFRIPEGSAAPLIVTRDAVQVGEYTSGPALQSLRLKLAPGKTSVDFINMSGTLGREQVVVLDPTFAIITP